MTTTEEIFALALRHHQAGNLQQAEQLYHQVLQADQSHADTYHLLGVLAHQRGQHAKAIASIRQALALKPGAAVYHSNLGVAQAASSQLEDALASFQQALLFQPQGAEAHYAVGNALRALGRLEEAATYYSQAVSFRTAFPEALNNWGNVLFLLGKFEEAVECYGKVLRLQPDWAETHCNLGNALCRLSRWEEAAEHCRRALRLQPDYADALSNLGNALRSQGKLEEAVVHCRRALQIRPSFPEAIINLGSALAELGRAEEAQDCLSEALRIDPGSVEAWSNLGNALALQEKLEEAVECYQQAIRHQPTYAEAYSNLGYVRVQQAQFDQAEACYAEALAHDANHAETHFNRALLWLLQGKWDKGFKEYEWRWRTKDFHRQQFRQPLWDGSPSPKSSRTLLLVAEQGLGDTLQFIRYLPLVRLRVDRIILQCQPPLMRILSNVSGIDQLLPQGSPLPSFDTYAPLLSLPRIFGTSPNNVPAKVPYLHADAQLVERWRRELAQFGLENSGSGQVFKIGIAWQGNPTYRGDRQRSIPLAKFAPLAAVKGVQLVSLQKRDATVERLESAFPMVDFSDKLDEGSGAFMETAAIMMSLDLVISSDTAVAHLAGALGVPVWVALTAVPDWRWLLERTDSPWYPTMGLFRQTRRGQWDEVFDRLAEELRQVNC
jgi:tetratricopeptide (TPR) repeat protein